MINSGLIHIYTGDGKGKTTASIGLIIRALGSGMRVILVQFLKNSPTSEIKILESLNNIIILRGKGKCGFSFSMTQEQREESLKVHNENLIKALKLVDENKCDMLVLDEVIGAYNHNLLDKNMLIDFLDNKKDSLEVVLTGRNPDEILIDRAHYISEIVKVRHPFDNGVKARVGIER
ncbi:MAG: cob(I)yrinic acid a,c-diamide adenosyltransferase [Clostridium sp.]